MSSTSRNRQHRNRRKGGSRSPAGRGRSSRPKPLCEICSAPIADITTAIARPNSRLPIHFECALDIVSEELNPGSDEKIIYLGKGSFAVVELEAYQQKRLVVKRQINWEDVENRGNWRMELRTNIQ